MLPCCRLILAGFALCCSLAPGAGASVGGVVVDNTEQDGLVLQAYLPSVEGQEGVSSVHFMIDLDQVSHCRLVIKSPAGVSILFQEQLILHTPARRSYHFSIDSLAGQYGTAVLKVSLYQKNGDFSDIEVLIVDEHAAASADSEQIHIRERTVDAKMDFNVAAMVIILMAGLMVKSTLKNLFFDYFSFRRAFSIKPISEALFSLDVFSSSNLLMISMYGMSAAFAIIIFTHSFSTLLAERFGVVTFSQLMIAGLLLAVLLALLMLGKFMLLLLVGDIFNSRTVLAVQFYDYFRLSMFITLCFLLVAALNASILRDLIHRHSTYVVITLVIMLAMRPLFIFLKLNKLTGYGKPHLFLYICYTEIVPLFIIIKFLLN